MKRLLPLLIIPFIALTACGERHYGKVIDGTLDGEPIIRCVVEYRTGNGVKMDSVDCVTNP